MPFLRIETSAPIADLPAALARASATAAALTGKDERWVMVRVEAGLAMLHGGSGAPCAWVTLASLGLPGDRSAVVAGICRLVADLAGIPGDRVYVRLVDLDPGMFGFDGETFAC